ncbi:MAG: tape measure protein [Clostridiaceae bacterium]
MANTVGAVFDIRDNFTGKAKGIQSATTGLKNDIVKATEENKKFSKSLDMGNSLDGLKSKVSGVSGYTTASFVSVSKSAKTLRNDVSEASQANNRFHNSLNLGSTIDNLKGKILGLATTYISLKGATSLFGAAIGQSSSMEQYRNTLNVVMKDNQKAAETFKWAVDFANKTPFETNEIVEGTVKLQSYGLTAKDVMTSIGDMSAVMGKSLDQGVEAIADAQTGEVERLKEFGVTKQMIIDQANKTMRGKQIVNNQGQITDQKAFNEALFSLMNEKFAGGMEKQSQTLKGLWSTVTGVTKNALAEIAGVTEDGTIKQGGLFDSLKNKVKGVGDTLTQWSQDGTLKEIGNTIETGFNAAGKAIGFLKDNINWIVPVVAGFAGGMMALNVINTVRGMIEKWSIVTRIQTIAQQGLNTVMKDNPIGVVVTIIGILIAVGVALYMHWDVVKAKCIELWSNLTATWESIKTSVIEKAQNLKESAIETFENFKKGIVEKVTSIKNKILEIWDEVRNFLAHPIDGTINLVKKFVGGDSEESADGSHRTGLDRVPFDGYKAVLHKDETVLTKDKANDYRNGNVAGYQKSSPIVNININGVNKSTREIVQEIVPELKRAIDNR